MSNVVDINGKQPCYCAAHGCPMLGTMSPSTSGGNEWWCFLHFGKDAVKLQAVTAEINRREWLAQTITNIRMTYGTESWAGNYKLAKHELKANQREDLLIGNDEPVWKWVQRLEGQLQAMCNATFTDPPKQARIETEGFQRLQLAAPETEPEVEPA